MLQKDFFGVQKVVANNIYFRHQYEFHCDNIGDLPIRSFWYQNNDITRKPCVTLYSHWPVNDPCGYLNTTFYLEVMPQTSSMHTTEGNQESKSSISSHDGLQNLLNIGPRVSHDGDSAAGIYFFPP